LTSRSCDRCAKSKVKCTQTDDEIKTVKRERVENSGTANEEEETKAKKIKFGMIHPVEEEDEDEDEDEDESELVASSKALGVLSRSMWETNKHSEGVTSLAIKAAKADMVTKKMGVESAKQTLKWRESGFETKKIGVEEAKQMLKWRESELETEKIGIEEAKQMLK
jgi:hypothetical protein